MSNFSIPKANWTQHFVGCMRMNKFDAGNFGLKWITISVNLGHRFKISLYLLESRIQILLFCFSKGPKVLKEFLGHFLSEVLAWYFKCLDKSSCHYSLIVKTCFDKHITNLLFRCHYKFVTDPFTLANFNDLMSLRMQSLNYWLENAVASWNRWFDSRIFITTALF